MKKMGNKTAKVVNNLVHCMVKYNELVLKSKGLL